MEKVKVQEDKNGRLMRVYCGMQVKSPDPLFSLQKQLAQSGLFTPTPTQDLHLTLFHYGRPSDLYAEIALRNPGLSYDAFLELFQAAVSLGRGLEMHASAVSGKNVDLFGTDLRPIVALQVEFPQELVELRRKILDQCLEFIGACGIENGEEFMNGSENLRYETGMHYKPHISLGHLNRRMNLQNIQTREICVELSRPRFFNVTPVRL